MPQICFRNDTIILRQVVNGYPAYTWPIGPDADSMLDEITELVREEDTALRFFAMNEEQLHRLLQDPRFPDALWGYERKWSDYLYTFESFATLNGGPMRKLRQRHNHFINLYGEPDIRPLKPENLPEVLDMLRAYDLEHPKRCKIEDAELRHTFNLAEAAWELELLSVGLWINNRLAAIAIGEVIGETLMIHVEKALIRYADAYPAIFIGLVHYAEKLYPGRLRHVNREDDSGDPGLREVKQRYHPERMVHKYLAHVRAPAAGMTSWPVLRGERCVLTPFRETDKDAYFRLNTDGDNNRFWGYNYEEDFTVPDVPTPDTFYESVQFDMAVGDSINYAIRETEEGPMIGEALLWNFTDAGSAEFGVRLLPEYIGKGLSREATPLVQYAEDILGMSTRVRCLNIPGNERAVGGASGSGFREVKRDETWIYLERQRKAEVKRRE